MKYVKKRNKRAVSCSCCYEDIGKDEYYFTCGKKPVNLCWNCIDKIDKEIRGKNNA